MKQPEMQLPPVDETPPDQKPPTLVADGGKDYGDGMRNLPQEIKDALLQLRTLFQGQSDLNRARREYVKKVLKLHEFFRGNHYGWWDFRIGSWRTGATASGGQQSSTAPITSQALYVMNFFQGFCLSIIGLLIGQKLTQKFFPEDPGRPEDINAAQKADLVMRIFEKNESPHQQLVRTIYGLCIGGTVGSYVRTVVDGERFGYFDQPVYEYQQVQTGPARYKCAICGDDLGVQPGACGACGAPLPSQPNIPATTAQKSVQTGTKRVPRGRTIRTVVDGLELKLPADAQDQSEFTHIVRDREIDKSIPRATYPEVASEIIGSSTSNDIEGTTEFERRVRRQANQGTTTENRPLVTDQRDRVTFSECWFRKKAFYHLDDDKIRQQLIDLFPEGCYAAFANDVFCEARPENMDQHWRICHAMPGRGQIREPIMAALVPMQEIANDLMNIIRDIIEYTLPVTFVNQRVLDVRKWARSQSMAGATYNVNDTGRPVSEAFFQTMPGRLPEFATTFLTQIRTEIAQFLTGAFPAAYGAGSPGNNTAQGIAIERQSALGRINLFLQAIREHYAECAPLIVEDFKKNAIEPMSYVDELAGGELQLSTVTPDDFEAGSFRTKAEVAEEYPSTWAQRQQQLLQFMASPMFGGWVAMLKNLTKVKATLGTELTAPGEDAYKRAFQMITQLLSGEPQVSPPMAAPPDPMTGLPNVDPGTGQPIMLPGEPASSIPPNQLDDNATILQACVDFYLDDRGAKAMRAGGPGWENFMLFVKERQALIVPPPVAPGQPPAPGAQAGPPALAAPPNLSPEPPQDTGMVQ
jgi:hypothetical protein